MNQPPLNPDALEAGAKALLAVQQPEVSADYAWNVQFEDGRDELRNEARAAVSAYLAVAQPVVTGEQVNLAGWTCNGIHEPGDYSTCEECRDACDDLARFFNHMMRNPRPFKHWTGNPEVKP